MSFSIEDLPERHRASAYRQLSEQLSKDSAGPGALKNPAGGPSGPVAPGAAPTSRIRQNSKPRSNRLETEFGQLLSQRHHGPIFEQAITFRLANGLRYTPDWAVFCESDQSFFGHLILYEVKGKKAWDDSIAKLKMAASVYPNFHWYLCDKPNGTWRETIVLP